MSAQQLAESEWTRESSDPFCVSDAETDELLIGAPWRRLVVIGDSLAEGIGDESPGYRSIPWPERLRDALRRQQPGLEYLNLGKRGLRAAEVRAGQLQQALDFRPDLAAVVCGGNDLLVETFDPEAVSAELDAIVAPLRRAGADVVTWTLQDITRAWPALAEGPLQERLGTLNDLVREVAERHGAILVDQRSLAAAADQDVYSQDLMHSSMRGHAIVAAMTIARLGRHLRATYA
jgi:lysophospholipase L1-like esterase